MTRKQCAKCPWKVGTDPYEIPGDYDEAKHHALRRTIADPESPFAAPLRIMACHETTGRDPLPCVGWLHNQLGEGNNIQARMAVVDRTIDADVEIDGPQHHHFKDTLPKEHDG